ncbi:MAG: ABC transporter permease [Methanophagales archaeon ANME-1-THS]|nr:MAG: ABC transporter permease [Methanophagales archaeon ANME-1-THS]
MKDAFLFVYRNMKERRARSALTVLGITVGIGAVIALISLGYGMQAAITEQLIEMADVIMVTPGAQELGSFGSYGSFTDRDLEAVKRIGGVKDAVAMRSAMEDVEYRGETFRLTITGINPQDIAAVFGETIKREAEAGMAAGRDLRENDKKACEIGYSIAYEYFKQDMSVNDRLTINSTKFRVVGVLEKQGGFRAGVDSAIYITTRDSISILDNQDISEIFVRVRHIEDAEKIAAEIEKRIDDNHKLDDFTSAMTMGSAIEQLESVFGILQVVLIALSSISLLVAAMGIMNTMLMSVMERTHEIGVMKAIGAKNRNILTLFLLEAGVVSAVGGVCGCILGILAARAISFGIQTAFDVEIVAIVKPEVLLGGIAVAVLVGILSGLYPARKAAKMSPVEAVKYA